MIDKKINWLDIYQKYDKYYCNYCDHPFVDLSANLLFEVIFSQVLLLINNKFTKVNKK